MGLKQVLSRDMFQVVVERQADHRRTDNERSSGVAQVG